MVGGQNAIVPLTPQKILLDRIVCLCHFARLRGRMWRDLFQPAADADRFYSTEWIL